MLQRLQVILECKLQCLNGADGTSEYWAASDSVDLVAGANTLSWGPFDANVHLKFTILLDSDDAVSFDSYVVSDGSGGSGGSAANDGGLSVTDAVSIDFNDGITGSTDVVTLEVMLVKISMLIPQMLMQVAVFI